MYLHVKNELIKALRLGGYTQTRDFLRRGDDNQTCRYCVLGLLIKVYQEHNKIGSWVGPYCGKSDVDDAYCFIVNGEYSIELPSSTILAWAGIDKAVAKKLFHLNDVERQTFAGIANYLEGMPDVKK